MKLLHTADLHIGAELSYLGQMAESRQYEVLEVFKNIISLCAEEKVDVCLIAGDLFDSNIAAKTFLEPVLRLIAGASHTEFYLICGNHDPLDASSPLLSANLPENLTLFGGEYETALSKKTGVRVMGRSFTHSSMEFEPADPLPCDEYINILLMHSDIGGASWAYNPIPASFIETCNAHYLALGHIHKRSAVEKLGGTYLAYPGCPEGQGFDETGVKGVYIGELSKDECNLSFIKTSKRVHIVKNIDLSAAENTTDAENIICSVLNGEMGEDYKNNLYKLVLTGSHPCPHAINIAELLASLKNKLYFVKLKNQIKAQIDLETLASEPSLKGIFVKNMLNRIENATEDEKSIFTEALYLGLEAFDTEVSYCED